MNRAARTDAVLNALNEERDDLAIKISLLADAETPDTDRLAVLRQKLNMLEHRISRYRPEDA
jgi:hypothetical protein